MKLPTVRKIEKRDDRLYFKCDLFKGAIKHPQAKNISPELGKAFQLERALWRFCAYIIFED